MKPTEITDLDVIGAMGVYGGSFVKALSEAAASADSFNLQTIKNTWPEYWKHYSELARKVNAKQTSDNFDMHE